VAAVAALALMVAQSVAYLGWAGFAFDVRQVYAARNNPLAGTGEGDRLIAGVRDFYTTHHVVFWYQLGSNEPLRDPGYFVHQLVTYTLQPLTPFFSLIVLLLAGGWLLSLIELPRMLWPPVRVKCVARACLGVALLGGASFAAALTLLQSLAALGLQGLDQIAAFALAVVFATVSTLVMTRLTTGGWSRFDGLPIARVVLASAFLLLAAAFVWKSGSLYDQQYASLELLGAWLPVNLATVTLLASLGVAAGLVLQKTPILAHRLLAAYLACGLLGCVVCYAVLPGYVLNDYLGRTAPLTVYVRDVAVSISLFVLGAICVRAARELSAPGVVRGLAVFGAAATLLIVGGYWLNLQRQLIVLLPPAHYSFLTQLSEPPFRGASFAANVNPAPIAAQTNQWAYTDQPLGGGDVTLRQDGYAVARDQSYLWVADAQTNPAYARPDYYLCVITQNLDTLARRLSGDQQRGCGQLGVVQLAGKDVNFPRDRVVAEDTSGRDGWAIVRLDWAYPPYLVSADASGPGSSGTLVSADIRGDDAHWSITPRFTSFQQTGEAPLPPLLNLYQAGSNTCLISSTDDPSGFVLPATYSSLVVVSVTPRTAEAVGQESFSEPFYVGAATYLLPDARTGAYQQVRATSVQQAEEQAAAAGAWDPAVADGLKFFTLPDIQSGTAQQVLAHSIDEAQKVAETAGTWNQKAGTFGVTSTGITLSKGISPCHS
jgi:hypothetical protein